MESALHLHLLEGIVPVSSTHDRYLNIASQTLYHQAGHEWETLPKPGVHRGIGTVCDLRFRFPWSSACIYPLLKYDDVSSLLLFVMRHLCISIGSDVPLDSFVASKSFGRDHRDLVGRLGNRLLIRLVFHSFLEQDIRSLTFPSLLPYIGVAAIAYYHFGPLSDKLLSRMHTSPCVGGS
ncbi:hypothetical protein YC2023_088551 [Brassica napus]